MVSLHDSSRPYLKSPLSVSELAILNWLLVQNETVPKQSRKSVSGIQKSVGFRDGWVNGRI